VVDEGEGGGGIYSTPFDESAYPITITVTSTATGGARDHPDAPTRTATATIRLEESAPFGVRPNGICVDRGETIAFSVVANAGDPPPVTWSVAPVTAGSFSGNEFTAGNDDAAPVTITATSIDDPSMFAEATISVQRCSCSWSATASGGFGGTWEGEVIEWSTIPGQTSFIFRVANDGPPLFPNGIIFLDRILTEGETGTFPAAVAFAASMSEFGTAGDETGGSAFATVLRNQNGVIQGSVIGTLIYEDVEDLPVSFNMSFIARTPTIEDPQPCRNDP